MNKVRIAKRGVVQKIIKQMNESEKVEISIAEADELYRDIRMENVFESQEGRKVRLKQGHEVDVVVEADREAVEHISEL